MREIVVIGDVEMGVGNLTDDFISDKTLAKLINSLTKKKLPVDLILNGDTIDFLKCPYTENGKKKFTRHITAEISREKLKLVYQAHKEVFTALEKFVQKKKNSLYFIIGNHDQDLFFKTIRNDIRKILKSKANIFFKLQYLFKLFIVIFLMNDCIFCKIVQGRVPAAKVYEDDNVISFLDIMPANKGHCLVVPKKHSETLLEISDEDLENLIIATKKVTKALSLSMGNGSYNVVMNNGKIAGQVVAHAHIHIIPIAILVCPVPVW